MDDAVDLDCVRERLERVSVREIQPLEAEAVAILPREPVEPSLLQRRVVIIVEAVDSDDIVTALHQRATRRGADEARGPGDKHSHVRSLGGAGHGARPRQWRATSRRSGSRAWRWRPRRKSRR